MMDINGLSLTHFKQMLNYVENLDRSKWNYGKGSKFELRHNEIRSWLTRTIVSLEQKARNKS